MKKIISAYVSFKNIGGAQKVLLNIHNALKTVYEAKLTSFDNYSELSANYLIREREYVKFNLLNLFRFRNTIFISHHRKITSIIYLINKMIFNNKVIIVHVAHNEFKTLRRFSFLGDKIIAVSKRVEKNLIEYFGIDDKKITVIYNGIKDYYKEQFTVVEREYENSEIKILYIGKIDNIKNQIDLVNNVKDRLDKIVKIYFAGAGPDEEQLKETIKDNNNFIYLGFIKNIDEIIGNYDYVMLFSKREGLPLSLIEAAMHGKPIICNDIGGNSEIVTNNLNGFICKNYDDLINTLNKLKEIAPEKYIGFCHQSRKVYMEHYSLNKMIENYYKYLNNIQLQN